MTIRDIIPLTNLEPNRVLSEFQRIFPPRRPVQLRDGTFGVRPRIAAFGADWMRVSVETVEGTRSVWVQELTPTSWRYVPRRLVPINRLAGPINKLP